MMTIERESISKFLEWKIIQSEICFIIDIDKIFYKLPYIVRAIIQMYTILFNLYMSHDMNNYKLFSQCSSHTILFEIQAFYLIV